jgi:hypothetical protein
LISCQVEPDKQERLDTISDTLDLLEGSGWRYMETCWLFRTDLHAATVRDALKRHLGKGDRLLVALLSSHAAWHGFERQNEEWLLAHL